MWSRCMISQVKHNSYFLVGMAMGLWVSLAVIPLEEQEMGALACGRAAGSPPASDAVADEFEPQYEEKPMGVAPPPARTVQRPRYYSTELAMRGSVVGGILTSAQSVAAGTAAALNSTAARLLPALKFFIAASGAGLPPRANLVGFTDTREMLRPFHALKYLADNYLEEYDYFYLGTDEAYLDGRRLAALAAGLSVGQHLYLGAAGDGDGDGGEGEGGGGCDLEGGVLLSNSVLRAVQGQLEWCVRNSYSPRHHDNLARCLLHAARAPCVAAAQGRRYRAAPPPPPAQPGAVAPLAALAGAVTARGVRDGRSVHVLHAGAARLQLEEAADEVRRLRAALRGAARAWPAGLRDDPTLPPPPPATRFDHPRWTPFNATHVLGTEEGRSAAPLRGAWAHSVALVWAAVRAWSLRRWPWAEDAQLAEGAWRWEPATALRYRVLVRLPRAGGGAGLRLVEAARALGAARLVPVRYVTESARLSLLLPVPLPPAAPDAAPSAVPSAAADALEFLRRYERVRALDKNIELHLVLVRADNGTAEGEEVAALEGAAQRAGAAVRRAVGAPEGAPGTAFEATRAALARDSLVLLLPPHADFNQDFLNRVRMNCISGEQWFLPLPFTRHVHPGGAAGADAGGAAASKLAANTGRFAAAPLLAAYVADLDDALAGGGGGPLGAALAAAPLRCISAPEPGVVLPARAAPCRGGAACGRAARAGGLGARAPLAQLLLETEARADPAAPAPAAAPAV